MKLRRWLMVPAVILTASLTAFAAQAQGSRQTPLADPIQLSGLAGGNQASSCGFLPAAPNQVLQVTEEFASFDIQVQGEGPLTLYIEGSNGFSECITTDRFSNGQIQAPGLLNQGIYNIYVGSQGQTQPSYTLLIQQR